MMETKRGQEREKTNKDMETLGASEDKHKTDNNI